MGPPFVGYIAFITKRFMYVHLDTSVAGSFWPPACPLRLLTTLIGEASQDGFRLQERHGAVFLKGRRRLWGRPVLPGGGLSPQHVTEHESVLVPVHSMPVVPHSHCSNQTVPLEGGQSA